MDAAHGEGSSLEEGQVGALFSDEAVLEDETSLDVAVGNDGEELGGVRVDVRGVETAGLEEDGCG